MDAAARRVADRCVALAGSRTVTTVIGADGTVSRVEIGAGKSLPDVDRKNNVWQRQ